MTKTELMRSVHAAIDRRASEIVALGEQIRRHPELGFKEFKTARLVEETMRGMGLAPKGGLAITGVRADAVGRLHAFGVTAPDRFVDMLVPGVRVSGV